jgi:hypothetical protein
VRAFFVAGTRFSAFEFSQNTLKRLSNLNDDNEVRNEKLYLNRLKE